MLNEAKYNKLFLLGRRFYDDADKAGFALQDVNDALAVAAQEAAERRYALLRSAWGLTEKPKPIQENQFMDESSEDNVAAKDFDFEPTQPTRQKVMQRKQVVEEVESDSEDDEASMLEQMPELEQDDKISEWAKKRKLKT